LSLPHIACEADSATGQLRFFDRADGVLLSETPGARKLTPSTLRGESVFVAEQSFDAPPDERLYGTGCFQDGALNLRGWPRRLTQVNTQISLPFILSSRGYGLLWHNTGMSEFNPPASQVSLQKLEAESRDETATATTTEGNAQLVRRGARFEGGFTVSDPGTYAFLVDVGKKMASRIRVEIDGVVCADLANVWLPPTTSFQVDLAAGEHLMRVLARNEDAPVVHFERMQDRTVWRSPVADAIDYVVIAGPGADDIMKGYRELIGETPILPRWAYGYIHCRERFTSSDEILENARTFRERRLPIDVIVQDWQYWGRHGWNAMRFDEAHYPDPTALVGALHRMNMRFMLSVWSRFRRKRSWDEPSRRAAITSRTLNGSTSSTRTRRRSIGRTRTRASPRSASMRGGRTLRSRRTMTSSGATLPLDLGNECV
jgi:alpha-D-xyloside xylohydrolase